MSGDLKLTDKAKQALESLCDAAMNAVSVDWTTLTSKSILINSASAEIIHDYKLPTLFHRNIFITTAAVDVAISGKIRFALSSLDAVTLAGFMLLMPEDKVTIKRKTVDMTITDLDAYKEACNILCGAYGKGLRNYIQKDISIAQTDTSFVSSSQLHQEKLLPGNPFILVQSHITMSFFAQSTLLQMFPVDFVENLLSQMDINEVFEGKIFASKGHILLIDPEKTAAGQLEPAARQCGFELICAADFAKALEHLKTTRVSLIILDATTGKTEHINAIQYIKTITAAHKTPVIACCNKANATKEIVMNALQSGANDFTLKPFDTAQIIQKIEKFTGH